MFQTAEATVQNPVKMTSSLLQGYMFSSAELMLISTAVMIGIWFFFRNKNMEDDYTPVSTKYYTIQ